MRSGISEWIGWAITLLGLLVLFLVIYLAMNRYVFEAMALSLPSVIVFRRYRIGAVGSRRANCLRDGRAGIPQLLILDDPSSTDPSPGHVQRSIR